MSDPFIVPAPSPILRGTASGPCEGDTAVLTVTESYSSYAWSTGDSTQAITITTGGQYLVVVTNQYGLTATADTIIHFHSRPPKPVITRNGNLLTSSDAQLWQWYVDGVAIAGAVQRSHQATQSGMYTVMITDINGCTALSDPFQVTVLSVEEHNPDAFALSVFPDPNSGRAFVRLTADRPAGNTAGIFLHDLLGRELYRREGIAFDGSITIPLDLQTLPAGSYLLRVSLNGRMRTRMIVRE